MTRSAKNIDICFHNLMATTVYTSKHMHTYTFIILHIVQELSAVLTNLAD